MRKSAGMSKAIGGQAVIEGVMVKCGATTAMAVRRKDGSITTDVRMDVSAGQRHSWLKLPLIRGCVNVVEQIRIGYVMLMKSARYMEEDELGEDEKPSRAAETAGVGLSLFLALVLMIGLFVLLPTTLAAIVGKGNVGISAFESIFRILIFVLYILAIGLLKDMRRIFMYHGAEHKTLHCYEHGEEPTPENAKKYSRLHPRCGTTYLFLVVLVSILVFSLVGIQGNVFVRMAVRIALLPLVAGIAYELLRFFAKHENWIAKVVRAPGLALQYLTTREPEPDMLEVAMTAIETAEREEARRNQDA